MKHHKIAIHTDILAEYLTHHGTRAPALRIAMMKFFCYTTVFNAIELFAAASNERERGAVVASMQAMKILGLSAKQAVTVGGLFGACPGVAPLTLLVAGVCMESKLPLLTREPGKFRGVRGLQLVRASSLSVEASGEEILGSVITQ